MLKNYLKTAWRSLWKNKGTSIINITGLSMGMTAAVLILLWVQNETSFDNYKDKKDIYRLTTRLPSLGWVWESTPLLLADAIKNEIPEVEQTARLNTNNWPVFKIHGALFYEKQCAYVDNGWFDLFQYKFLDGNATNFNAHPFSIILAASEAKKYFGDKKAVGQTIHIDSMDYKVSAVIADAPINSSFQYKAYIPIAALLANTQIRENDEQWGNANYISFVKINPNSSPKTIEEKISGLLKRKSKDADSSPITMTSLVDMHFDNEIQNSAFEHGDYLRVYLFSFLGFLLLLIACINYVNLSTAKASIRSKEVSIRKIAGANRSTLFFQFVFESLIISIISLVVTLVLVQLSLPVFNWVTEKSFTLPLTSIALWQVLGITLSISILLNSIYPALLLSSFKPLNVLKGITVLKTKNTSFRKGLVVLQFTISVMLIIGTIVIFKQMQFVQNSNLGYNRSQLISFALPFTIDRAKRQSTIQAMKKELLSQSGIEGVSTSNQPIVDMGSYCSGCANWEGHDTSINPKIAQLSVDADFQKVAELQMREGRWFEEGNSLDSKNVVLNETAVKDFNLHAPVVGQTFIFKGDTGQVIGVVKDFTYKTMHEKIGPLVAFNDPDWRNHFMVRIAPKSISQSVGIIEKIWQKYIPESPIEYTFLDDSFNSLYKKDRQSSILILSFAIIAIFISMLGLFSLAAFEAEQRTKEIGIRKVLGASVMGIATLLSKDFLKLVMVAIAVAIPLAWMAMNKWLQDFAYRINIGWWIFILAVGITLVVALITVSFQAIKAALANPVKSLRTE
ncbi:MAG: ABC transporter permease [Bacteroidetes bacterium]|nr:ABC transporter permease [Bacteroidota bacterium]